MKLSALGLLGCNRPSIDEYFLYMAQLVAARGTCKRRQVGCVLVDARNHVISTGYNGVASGLPHCNYHDPFYDTGYPNACEGAFAESGTDLHKCEAIHAENNALIQCTRPYDILSAYVTVSPCIHCTRLLLNTSCKRIVFTSEYPHHEAKNLWINANRDWVLQSHDQTDVQISLNNI